MRKFLLLFLLPLLLVSDANAQLLNPTTIPIPETYIATAAASFTGKSCGSTNLTVMTLTQNRRMMRFRNQTDQPVVVVLNGVQALYLPSAQSIFFDFFTNGYFFPTGMTVALCYPGSVPTTSTFVTDGVI